jgi:hypothetical protein
MLKLMSFRMFTTRIVQFVVCWLLTTYSLVGWLQRVAQWYAASTFKAEGIYIKLTLKLTWKLKLMCLFCWLGPFYSVLEDRDSTYLRHFGYKLQNYMVPEPRMLQPGSWKQFIYKMIFKVSEPWSIISKLPTY